MKTKLVAVAISFFVALFCAAALLSPAIAGADESDYSHIKATVINQTPAQDKNGFYWETEVLTRYGNILSYKETDQLYRGRPLILEVYTPDNNPSHWIITNIDYPLTTERTIVFILISVCLGIIGKNL